MRPDIQALEVAVNETQPHRSFQEPSCLLSSSGVHWESGVTAWNRREATRRDRKRRQNASDWISQALSGVSEICTTLRMLRHLSLGLGGDDGMWNVLYPPP